MYEKYILCIPKAPTKPIKQYIEPPKIYTSIKSLLLFYWILLHFSIGPEVVWMAKAIAIGPPMTPISPKSKVLIYLKLILCIFSKKL